MESLEVTDLRDAMVRSFLEAVEEGVNLIVVLSDSTSTSKIAPFAERYPERLVDVGIAEQNLVGVAVGLSLGGYVAVTANAAPFLVARANEQVKNDVCYSETNVKLVGLNAGVCYGALASTHHAIDDLSIMRGLGHIQIFAPSDAVETEGIFRHALACRGPVYIRMDNAKLPVLHERDHHFAPGQVDILKPGKDITLAAVGSVVHEAYFAALELQKDSIDAEVLNLSSLRPIDREAIARSMRQTRKAITVEEHSVHGGIGSLVAEILAEERLDCQLMRLGIPEGQFSKAGPRGEIRAHYLIDQMGIAATARRMVGRL